MKRIVECVPNFSEGRDASKVDAIVAANRELLTLHELIAHRMVQILIGQHRGRVYSV